MKKQKGLPRRQAGQAAILIVFVIGMISVLIGISLIKTGFNESIMGRNTSKSLNAFYAANSGVEEAFYRLNHGSTNPGSFAIAVGAGSSAQVEISGTGDQRTIEAIGKYKNLVRKIKTEVVKTTIDSPFQYAIQAGNGGLEFTKKADIVGDIYSNGDIAATKSVNVGGSVFAYGSVSGLVNAPSITSPAPKIALPAFDFSVMQIYLKKYPTIPGPYSPTGSLGNVTINGDLNIGTDILLTGPIWVTGNLNIKANITLDSDIISGGVSQIMVAEKIISIKPGSDIASTGGVFLLIVSTYDPLLPIINLCNDASIIINSNIENILYFAPNGCLDIDAPTAAGGFTGSAIGKKIIFKQLQDGLQFDTNLLSAEFGLTKKGGWLLTSFKEE